MTRSTTSHWKDARTGEGALAPGRTARRWLATLATLALIGLLVAIFWRPGPVIPRLVPVAVREFDDQSLLSPLPYVDEDVAALVALGDSRFTVDSDAQSQQTATTAANLLNHVQEQLHDAQWAEDDVLVLYLLTHGLTLPAGGGSAANGDDVSSTAGQVDVKAVLADSGFRFGGGGVAVADVLSAADKCRAGTKLVVLDVSRIPSLPSEGMFVNELARAVVEELQRTEEGQPVYGQDLWVLLPCGVFEVATVDDRTRRSVFGRAFEEAVRCPDGSGIDANDDEQLSVGELYAAVRHRVRERSPGQTVLLIRGGAGLIESDSDLANSPVVVSTRRPAEEEPQDAEDSQAEVAERIQPSGPMPEQAESQVAAAGSPASPPQATSDGAVASTGGGTEKTSAAAAPSAAPAASGGQPSGDGVQLAALQTATAENAAAADGSGQPANPAVAATAAEGQPATAAAEVPPEKRPRRPIFAPIDEKLPMEERFRTQLARAWQVNDYLTSRDTHGGWSPVDFAPLAWRRSEARLIEWNREYVLAANDEGRQAVLSDVSDELARLNALAEEMDPVGPGPSTSSATREGNHLLEAWRQFWQSKEQQAWQEAVRFVEFETGDPEARGLGQYMEVSRAAANLVYASAEFAAFYDALLACGATDTQARTFATTLKEYLEQLTTLGEQLRDGSAEGVVAQEAREAADGAHRALQAQIRRLAGLVEAQRTSGGVPRAALIAVHKARASRGGARSMPPGREEDEPPTTKNARAAVFGTRSFQEQSQDRAEIYMRLAELALLPELGPAQLTAEISVGDTEQGFLDSTRRVGRQLQAAFALVARHVAAGQDEPLLAAQRARILDPHMIRSLEPDLRQPYFKAPTRPVPDRAYVVVAEQGSGGAAAVRLAADRAQTLPLSIRLYGSPAADPRLTFTYDAGAMTVVHDGRTISSGTPTPLSDLLGANAARRGKENLLELQLVGEPVRSGGETAAQLTVSLDGGGQDDLKIPCILPLARPFLLAVGSDTSALQQAPSGIWSDPLELRPYPNRKTTFPFQLKNLSGAGTKVDIALFAAQEDLELFRQKWREQDSGMDISQQLDRLLGASPVLVGEVKGLQLDGQESKAVTFTEQKPPQPPPAEQGGAAGAAAAPAAPPADAAEAVDVTRGLIAVVTEGDRKTHFFIEVEPRPPGSFLVADAEIVPSGGAEVLRIGVRPRPGEQIPGLADAPLIVKFSEENPVLDRRLQIRDRGEIPSNTAEAQLEFALRRDETQWRVLLDVGSMLGESEVFYNRALDLQITDQRGEVRVEDRRGDYNMVQIDELWMGADEKTRIRFRGQAELPNAQFSVRTLRGAPAPVITIGFHVDARNSAFTRFGDQVKLWAGGQLLDLDQKHADRQVAARVVELGVDGLVLQTRVEDFWYEWRPQQSEAVVPLRLELVLAEGGKTEYTTSVKLDAELPKIVELTEGTLPVSRSGAPQLVVKAFDTLTGISRVQVARNFDPDQAFGDNDTVLEAVNIQLGYIEAEQVYRWQGDLPADLAKPGETVRLAVRAFDGVGHASEPRITEVTLPRQLGPPPPPKGTIVGTASFSGRPEEPITVTLAGPDGLMRSAVIDDQKKFLFSELPAGDYTLSAEGSVRLQVAGVKKVSGTEPVSGFDPAKTKTRAVTLTLRTSE